MTVFNLEAQFDPPTIASNLQKVHSRVTSACNLAGRNPDSVRLLAVSKKWGAGVVIEAIQAGQRDFGENYVAEGVEKIAAVRAWLAVNALPVDLSPPLQWHCIGPVQSNKTRLVAENFDWLQSLDRLKVAERLSEQRPLHLPPLQVCLQINIDGSASKSGIAPGAEALALALAVAQLPRLRLRGLMAIPEPAINSIAARADFIRLAAVFDQINEALRSSGGLAEPMDTLSIGMSADLEPAIEAGSTMVRVGTAIFGVRSSAAGSAF